MKLSEIRQANGSQLIEAIKDVVNKQRQPKAKNRLTLGEMHATTSTIMSRAKQIGMSIEMLNEIARGN